MMHTLFAPLFDALFSLGLMLLVGVGIATVSLQYLLKNPASRDQTITAGKTAGRAFMTVAGLAANRWMKR